MSKKKIACPGAATPGQAVEIAKDHASFFVHDITSEGDTQPLFIESLLPKGEENALCTADLMKMAGLSDKRALQHIIAQERAHGALILSKGGGRGGYFLAANRDEIAAYEKTLTRRALSTLKTLKTARAALREIEGQGSLFDSPEGREHG